MKARNILLITATITPPLGASSLLHIDPNIRIKEYEKSLIFYLSFIGKYIDNIVFAENSNSDISSLRDIAIKHGVEKQVEFLVWYGLDYPPSYSRAYGEFKLIDYVMQHSQIISDYQEQQIVIWKITGRYIANNIAKIISCQPKKFDLYINFRNYPLRWADMYLFAWTLKGYQSYLNNVASKVKIGEQEAKQGQSPEELFRQYLESKSVENVKLIQRFNITPQNSGIRGYDGKNYTKDLGWKFYIRRIALTLFPWIWI